MAKGRDDPSSEAVRLLAANRLDEAESVLLGVSSTAPGYRAACLLLSRIAVLRGEVPFRVDHHLQPFLRAGPRTDDERRAFATLAQLYDAQGLEDLAAEVRAALGEARLPAARALPDLPPLDDGPGALPSLPSLPADPARTEVWGEATAPSTESDVGDLRSSVWKSLSIDVASPIARGPSTRDRTPVPTPPSDGAKPRPLSRPAATPSGKGREGGGKFQIGAVVARRYEIVDTLGKGGMAAVYRVRDLELDEDVALKVFLKSVDDSDDEIVRFKRELKLARRLRHPNIVQLFDLGEDLGHAFITMELLEGHDLHRVLRSHGGPIPLTSAALLLLDALAGLGAAHATGVVHRDVKPANLFLTAAQVLKVMDFGIAKGSVDAGEAATRTGMMMGTPQYMAPEQAQDAARVGPTSDLYAIGVILYEMLAGRRPFDGDNAMNIIIEAVTKPPPPLATVRPDLPPPVLALTMALLEKDPAQRPQSASEVASVLVPFAR